MTSRRVLLVANEPVDAAALEQLPAAVVVVVAPALNGRLAHWVSDEDRARRAAHERLALSLVSLRAAGFDPDGWVGDADPLLAIEDALRVFDADEIVVASDPEPRHWLARDLLDRARRRFARPVSHLADGHVTRPTAASVAAGRRVDAAAVATSRG